MSGFRLGFGVVSVLFGPSARGLGGAIDFNTKRRAGALKQFFQYSHCGHGQSCGPPSFSGPFEAFEAFGGSWRLLGASWALSRALVGGALGRVLGPWSGKGPWPRGRIVGGP